MNGLVTTAKRFLRHANGIHTLECRYAPTISGHWVWRADCDCGTTWRGAEHTRAEAREQVARFAGPKDTVEWPGIVDRRTALWPEVRLLRRAAQRVEIPAQFRGVGDVVACDGSLRASDRHAGWALVTNAGWAKTGTLPFNGATIDGLELLAIAEALRLYEDGDVWVFSDSTEAIAWARNIIHRRVHRKECPSWMPAAAFFYLRAAKHRGVRARFVKVPSKREPLHNLADRYARNLESAA